MSSLQKAFERHRDCPELSQLFEAMEVSPADPRRVKAEEHIATCAACQTEWSLFQQFDAGQVRPEERAAVEYIVRQVQAKRADQKRSERTEAAGSFWQRFPNPAWLGGAAIAMAAVVMAIGIATQWRTHHPDSTTYDDNQTLRSQSVNITTPLSEITQPPQTVSWESVRGATTYVIVFTEVDGSRIFYTNVTSMSLVVPVSVRKLLEQGRPLLLTVTASDATGRELARSRITRIRVTSK